MGMRLPSAYPLQRFHACFNKNADIRSEFAAVAAVEIQVYPPTGLSPESAACAAA